mgnify:CR=1 FL=1
MLARAEDAVVRVAAAAMGTRFEAVLCGRDSASLRAAGEAAMEEIRDADARYSLFRRDSLLSHINRTAAERPVRVDRETFAMLACAMEVNALAGGAFDITLAPLMRVWKFHDGSSSAAEPASAEEAAVGMDLVELDEVECTVRFKRPGVSLDLGGLAKGAALVGAAAVLRQAGVTSALVHGGTSSVTAIGAPPGRDGWRVQLGRDAAPVVVLRDMSLSVSAPSGRIVERNGERLGHIIDPRTRAPATCGIAMAAAIDESPLRAEGFSTAMVVLGARPMGAPPEMTSVILGGDGEYRVEGARADLVLGAGRGRPDHETEHMN